MIIQNNVLRHYLRNVFFVSGNACGGKTTMSRMLAEKYGFLLYDMDETYPDHRAIAEEDFQPDTCYHMKDFHEQWTRPREEQARWNLSIMREQADMVLLDLVQLAQDRPVVADVLYSSALSPEIVDYHRIIFLTVNRSMIRSCYFNRPEKQSFYEFVKKQPLADRYFENIFQGLELTNDREQEMMRQSGLKMLERTPSDTRESVLSAIEKHFQLVQLD